MQSTAQNVKLTSQTAWSRGAGHRVRDPQAVAVGIAAGLASVTAAGRLCFVRFHVPRDALRLSVTLCACDQLRRCRVRASAPALDPARAWCALPPVHAWRGSSFRQDSTESRAPASLRDRCGRSDCLPVKCAGARCRVSLRFSVCSVSVPDQQHEQAHRAPVRSSSRSRHRLPVCSM